MNTIRFDSKDSFIAALESRRPFWQAIDKAAEKQHKAAERRWHTEAVRRLREAAKLDYDALKAKVGSWNSSISIGDTVPKCPVLQEARIDKVLAALKFTSGKTFTVDSSGVWSEAHDLLTADPDARRTVC